MAVLLRHDSHSYDFDITPTTEYRNFYLSSLSENDLYLLASNYFTTPFSCNLRRLIDAQLDYVRDMYDEFELLSGSVLWFTSWGDILWTIIRDCCNAYWKTHFITQDKLSNIETLLDLDAAVWLDVTITVIKLDINFLYPIITISDKFLYFLRDTISDKFESLYCHETLMEDDDSGPSIINLYQDPTPGTTALENFLDNLV